MNKNILIFALIFAIFNTVFVGFLHFIILVNFNGIFISFFFLFFFFLFYNFFENVKRIIYINKNILIFSLIFAIFNTVFVGFLHFIILGNFNGIFISFLFLLSFILFYLSFKIYMSNIYKKELIKEFLFM